MGVSMSITAFPVLARILVERRMLKRPVGVLALACAAVDDVTAWFLIALATAVAVAGSRRGGGRDDRAWPSSSALVMGFAIRPLLARVSTAYDEAGRVPGGWVALIFAGVLLSAYATEQIGIALIFGAFVMGLIMPRRAGAHRGRDAPDRGLRRHAAAAAVLRLHRACGPTSACSTAPSCGCSRGVLLVVAVVGKLFGATIAARLTGFDWRSAQP